MPETKRPDCATPAICHSGGYDCGFRPPARVLCVAAWLTAAVLVLTLSGAHPALALEHEQAMALIDGGKGLPGPWQLQDLAIEADHVVYRFRAPDIGEISVVLEGRDPGKPCFASTRNLNLSYNTPPGGLDEQQELAVGAFMQAVTRIVDRNDSAPLFAVSAAAGPTGESDGKQPPVPEGGNNAGNAARNGVDYGGVTAQGTSGVGLVVVDALLWLLCLAALVVMVRVVVQEVRGWGRRAALGTVAILALSALVRCLVVPHATVQVGMGHPVIAAALTLENLPRYGAAGPLLYHALFTLVPPGMSSVLWLHSALSLANALLLATWFARLLAASPGGGPLPAPQGPGRAGSQGLMPVLSIGFLALTPLFLRDGNSESLLVPAVFLLFSGAVLLQESLHRMVCPDDLRRQLPVQSQRTSASGPATIYPSALLGTGHQPSTIASVPCSSRSRSGWLLLAAALPLLALGSHFRPELLLVAPLLVVVTALPYLRRDRRLLPLAAMVGVLLLLTVPYALFVAQAVRVEAARGNLLAERFLPHLMLFDWMWRNLFWRPLLYPTGLTVLAVAALVLAALARRGARTLLPVILLAVVWMALYHVDFNDESMLRLHVPGMMLVALVAAAGVLAVCERWPARARLLTVVATLLVAATALPNAGFVFFATNYQAQDRLFPQMVAALPKGPVNFVSLIGRDEPGQAWSQASLAEDPNREGAPPVHRYFGSYLLEPPLRKDRLMSLTEFRERPDWTRKTFFFLSTQCYAMREPFGYEEWGVDQDPLRLLHPACRWMLSRHVLAPVLVFRIPNAGEFAGPFQWYPPSLDGMTVGLFEIKPGNVKGPPARDSFATVAGQYYSLAREPLMNGDFASAERILLDADALLADSTVLWDFLASIYFLEGAKKDDRALLETALGYLLKIADRDIHYPGLLKSIAAVHATLKRFLTPEEDARYIADRLGRDPNDLVGLWLEAVRQFYTHERYEESLVLLNRVLERVSDDSRVYVYVALDHFYQGRRAEAEAAVEKAIAVAGGSDPDAYYVRSIIVRDRNLDLAVQDIERYLKMSEGADKVRNEVKQKWLLKEIESLRKGNPSPWWKGGGHDEPWNQPDALR